MLRPGILTTFHLPVQDHSYPALALGGITVYPSTLTIVRFPLHLSFDGSSRSFIRCFRNHQDIRCWIKASNFDPAQKHLKFLSAFAGDRIAWPVRVNPPLIFTPDATLPGRVSQISALTSLIKVPSVELEELRRLPANRDQTDNQLLGSLAGKLITILYPEAGTAFAVGCERYYPESVIPAEIKERPEGTKVDELTF